MAPALGKDALEFSGGVGGTPKDKFHQLVDDLSRILGPSSGLDSADIDVKHLEELMINYVSKESEWQRYAFSDRSRGYTRNLVDEGNGKSNLLVLVWTPGKGSPIHDHADAHCLMKVLKGTLRETRFSYPDPHAPSSGPKVIKETTYKENEVTYMADELGLHKISNPDQERLAVSLHRKWAFHVPYWRACCLDYPDIGACEDGPHADDSCLVYTPPNAAREGCNIFCEKTGKKSHVTQSNFYSIFGCKVGS